jgi:hypothetical protein
MVMISPTLQLAANESKIEQFKQQLLTELMTKMKKVKPTQLKLEKL